MEKFNTTVKEVKEVVTEQMKALGLKVYVYVDKDGIDVSFDSSSKAICEAAREGIERHIGNVMSYDFRNGEGLDITKSAFAGITKLAVRFSTVRGLMTTSVKARFAKFIVCK